MDKIFKWFTLPDDLSKVYVDWFTSIFELDDFKGMDKLFYSFLSYCSFLSISAERKYLEAFLLTDGKTCIKENNVHLDTMTALNYKEPSALEEAFRIIGKAALDMHDAWCTVSLEDRTFKVDMYKYFSDKKKDAVSDMMIKHFPLLTDGTDVGEVSSSMQLELARIDELYDVSKLDELDFMLGQSHVANKKKTMRHLFNTGLSCIDEDSGGIFSKSIITFNGQPGAGKTRFASRFFIYQALVVHKLDVLYDSVEMKAVQIENVLIAIHIVNLYRGAVKIPDSLMNTGRLTAEQEQYYNSARIDLFESGKYGRLFFRDSKPVEKMEKTTKNLIKKNRNLQLWVIDYMGRLKSVPESKYERSKQQFEVITAGYEVVRTVVDTCDIVALCLNQYNEKGIAAAEEGKKIRPGYVEGGMIVQRHSDYDLSMTVTEEQDLAGLACLSTSKKRGANGFRNVLLKADKSISNFIQINQNTGK